LILGGVVGREYMDRVLGSNEVVFVAGGRGLRRSCSGGEKSEEVEAVSDHL